MQFILTAKPEQFFRILFIILAVNLIFACSSAKSESDNRKNASENKSDAPVSVTVERAVSREVPAYIQATGTLVAQETSDVAPKAAGKVTNVYANVGQFVTQGSVIARLDDKDTRLRVAEAEANVKQAQSAVRQAEARLGLEGSGRFNAGAIPEVRAANANYEQAQAELRQAEANEKRYRELVETGDVPMMTYEQYRTQRDTARARVNAAKQALEAAINTARQSNQAIASAQAAVEAARTQVATAQAALADLVVRAPFSGFVSERPVAVGEYVSSSTPVATILRTNPIKAELQVAESDVPFVSVGRGVSIQVEAYKDRNFGGTVTAINPAVDPNSRSAVIEASVENSGNALRTGMFATGRIVRQGGNTGVFVPRAAVLNDPTTQSYKVFVIEEGLAKLRVAQIGSDEGEFIQILNGVNADELVATSNLEQLYEGAKVQAVQ